MKYIILFFCLCISGCDFRSEPYWKKVCVKSQPRQVMMPIMAGKALIMVPQTLHDCLQYEMRCIVPKKATQHNCPTRDK